MYSYEISQLLLENNYNIDSETYLYIINTSPQIRYVGYKPFGNYFEITDNQDNYWKFTVYKKD